MTLKDQLEQQKTAFITNAPIEVQTAVFQFMREQQFSGIDFGPNVMTKAPNFTLSNPLGEPVTLVHELASGPVILTFYRGSWCPFCNIQLRAYQRMLPDITKLGGSLIAISPQSPDNTLSQREKEELSFQVLSDPNGLVAESYNLLFELPEYLQLTYKNKLGRDFAAFNNTARWILPVPATFIIDTDGIIRYRHVNPDFTKRMEPEEIVVLLKQL